MGTSEFTKVLRERVESARQALREAEQDEDYYAVDVRTGELNSLLRLAEQNGVDLAEYPAQAGNEPGNRPGNHAAATE
jgi:hypothetical protein